jgi:hypothetical protein
MRNTEDILFMMEYALREAQGRLEHGKLDVFRCAYEHIKELSERVQKLEKRFNKASIKKPLTSYFVSFSHKFGYGSMIIELPDDEWGERSARDVRDYLVLKEEFKNAVVLFYQKIL